jgi:putative component of membrane protein insertase Oxa1/YidC/SpoIIIJ protein YidD
MRIFLLLIIKVYWVLIPKSKRRKCLFKTSCSNYVYKVTKNEGLFAGIKALRFRVKNCNPNYNIINVNNESLLITSTNKVFKEQEIRNSILN